HESMVQQHESMVQQHESMVQQHESMVQQHEFQIQYIYTSAVWRLFKPIQWCLGQYRRIQQEGLRARIRAFLYKTRIMKPKSQSKAELSECDAGSTATVAHNSTHASHANPD
ncbi:MAG: hypothetical protein EBU92_10840, partial [Betaproteobacteria bacterium]|nr:hypothetical protein [Betaproteobacteria bacterium]